jgi:hypothetical protein
MSREQSFIENRMDCLRETQQQDFKYLRDRLELLESYLGIKYDKKPRYEKIEAQRNKDAEAEGIEAQSL